MDSLLEEILQSPLLNEYADVIQKHIKEETKRRTQYYKDITEQQKAEFINGEIIVHSPVKHKYAVASNNLFTLLRTFVIKNDLGEVHHEKVLIRLTRNDFEPDICFFNNEKTADFHPDQMFFPAPDFIVEILSESTEKRDRGIKFQDYALHGVKEYWLVDTDKKFIEQYTLYKNRFELVQKTSSGTVQSLQVENFRIPVSAIFDEQKNLKALAELSSNQ